MHGSAALGACISSEAGTVRAGLLRLSKGGKPVFAQLSRALKLMVDMPDPARPTDPAYVYSGYAPISIRLVQAALRCASFSFYDLICLPVIAQLTGNCASSGNPLGAVYPRKL